MLRLKFWLSVPLVLQQALRLKKTAPRFAGASGPSSGRCAMGGAPRELRLLAIGDSIIAGVGASTLENALVGQTARAWAQAKFCSVSWDAIGKIGLDAGQIWRELVPKIEGIPYDAIVLSTGVNDVTGVTSTRSWRRNLVGLVHALHKHSPKAVIVVAGVPPMRGFPLLPQPLRKVIGWRAELLDQIARHEMQRLPYVSYVPLEFEPVPEQFSADGYHPSESSYTAFGQLMASAITAHPDATALG